MAADIVVPPEEVPLSDWTGFYIGLQGGWKHHEDEVEDPEADFGTDLILMVQRSLAMPAMTIN
jgi:hypothetical protein